MEELKINRTVEDLLWEEQDKPQKDKEDFWAISALAIGVIIGIIIKSIL
jgi:hypothetical protein